MKLHERLLRTTFQQLATRPPQALLVEGVGEHGASYEATIIAEMISNAHSRSSVRSIERQKDKTVIGIDQIQALYRESRSRQTEGRNVWLINDAHHMSEEAQDAFLKLLEEPPAAAVFILSVNNAENILSTVQSRCQVARSLPLSPKDAEAYLKECGFDEKTTRQQLLFLADSSANELMRLTTNKTYREAQLQAAAEAKTLISGNVFDKIGLVAQLANDRAKALQIVELSMRMLLSLSTRQAKDKAYLRHIHTFARVHEGLLGNGNVRIQLLRLVVEAN